MRPSVALLFVFLSSERLDAKSFGTLVAYGYFRWLTAEVADVVGRLLPGIGRLTGNCFRRHGCLPLQLDLEARASSTPTL